MKISMKELNAKRVLAIIAIPFLLCYIYIASSWTLSDMYSRPTINALRDWKEGQFEPSQDDWLSYQSNLEQALSFNSTNAEIYRHLGLVIQAPYTSFQLGHKDAMEARKKALDYYRQAINLRPTWPYHYSDLALVKFRLLEIDEEFYDAMYASMEFGPWEPDVQRVIAEIGMVLWNILGTQDRQFILDTIRKSFKHANKTHADAIRKAIEKWQFVDRVCEEVEGNIDLVKYCDKSY